MWKTAGSENLRNPACHPTHAENKRLRASAKESQDLHGSSRVAADPDLLKTPALGGRSNPPDRDVWGPGAPQKEAEGLGDGSRPALSRRTTGLSTLTGSSRACAEDSRPWLKVVAASKA